jgi:hypothetical protein
MAVEAGSLSFWRVIAGKHPKPAAIYEALQAGEEPDDLEDLDTRKLMAAVRKQYPSAEREEEILVIDLEDEETGIEVAASKKHVHFDFFGDAFRQMDRVMALMRGFGLACYDAGEEKLYPPDEPAPRFEMTPEESAPLDAMFAAMSEQADEARSATNDPQARLKMLKSFVDSGALQREVDRRMGEQPAENPAAAKKTRKKK